MKVAFSYLKEKFSNPDSIWARVKETVLAGDFTVNAERTVGREVYEFEKNFAEKMGAKYAVGVANGTDAIELSLIALGIGHGDEVIAPANTFVASLGAIGNVGARPILVDMAPDHVMDTNKIEEAITDKTKAILPVHFCGNPVEMDKVMSLAKQYNLKVVEDACQAYLAEFRGKCVGTWGDTGCFSLHPLKILNVWGDGGVITTNDDWLYDELKLLQNHGMATRDLITKFPCRNSRLDAVHAAVANSQLDEVVGQVRMRRSNADYYDKHLSQIDGITTTIRKDYSKSCYHLYFFEVHSDLRDALVTHLIHNGVEAKIHYKTPLYLQPGIASKYGYERGNFPAADFQSQRYITLPVDEHMNLDKQNYVISTIREFMGSAKRSW